ncbi:hypothetical protein HYV74_03355 [Candidatus Uhrbacteria bacterium]|nr:hypothetical protein [Candidatus Uhrbacteria bacterium]
MSVAYRSLLTTAWSLTTHLRRFWYVALLGGLLIGSGVGTATFQVLGADPTSSVARAITTPREYLGTLAMLWAQARATGTGATAALIAYAALLSTILIAVMLLAVHGVNVLILATERRSRRAAVDITLHRDAMRALVPTTILHCITKGITIAVLAGWLQLFIAVAQPTAPIAAPWAVAGFLAATAVLTIIEIVTAFALTSIVLDGRTPFAALRDGAALCTRYLRVVLEHSLLFTAAHVAAFLLWLVGSALLMLPFAFLVGIGSMLRIALIPRIAIPLGMLTLIGFLASIAVLAGIFLVAAWTLLYLRLTSPGAEPEPWLLRYARKN